MRNKYRKSLLAFMLLLLSYAGLWAQSLTVTGIVKDKQGSLPGATIYVMGNNERALTGTTTNDNGEYYLTIPASYAQREELKIIFSFIGYKPHVIPYKNQKVLNVQLEEEMQLLDEVSVSAKRKNLSASGIAIEDLGGSSQRINMAEMAEMPVTSIEEALQGRLANVDIISSSGDPGSRMAIRIRGTSSLNASSEPLVVIDGIPIQTTFDDNFDFATANSDDFGALLSISPTDIEDIQVLKDAAETAIWGSEGAGGVIVITTKKGTKTKTRFSFSQKLDIKKEGKQIKMLNGSQYVTLMQDELWNRMVDNGFTTNYYNQLSGHPELNYDPTFLYFNEYRQNTDWVDLITKTDFTSETAFSMYGGGERATYRFSTTYTDEGGTTMGTGYKRLTTRLNIDYRFSTKLRVGAQFAFTQGDRQSSYSGGNMKSARAEAFIKMPNMSPFAFNADGQITDRYFIPTSADGYTPWQGTWSDNRYNPLALVKESFNDTQKRDIRVQFDLNYNILPGLNFNTNMAVDINTTKSNSFLPQSATGVNQSHVDYNLGVEGYSENFTINIIPLLTYSKNLGKHTMVLSARGYLKDYVSSSYSTQVSGSGSQNLADPAAGANIKSLGSGSTEQRSVLLSTNAHYKYDDRYMITFGYNHQGNSRMGNQRRFGGFFNVSGQWRISNENFLKDFLWLDEMAIKASWGESGNSPDGSYPYVGTFSPEGTYMGYTGIGPNTIQLNNLKWETVRSTNVGFNTRLFNKLEVDFYYYIRITDDMLQRSVSLPSSTGFSSVSYYNDGKIKNNGVEFYFSINDILNNKDFNLSFNANISRNRNRVLRLPQNMNYESYTFGNGNYAQRVVEGQPVGAFYGYKYLGVYQNVNETIARDRNGREITDIKGEKVYTTINNVRVMPGDAHYQDLNSDGVIDRYDITYLGNSMPIATAGFGVNLRYKDLSVRTFFQARIGQKVINQTRIETENMYRKDNQSTVVLKRWRKEGDQTDIPRALYERGYNYLGSDRFVEDATFLRFKQLTISYNLPKAFVQRIGFQRANVYATFRDICTFTKYKGQDPEVGFDKEAIYQVAKDNSRTPTPFRLALGLSFDL